MIFKCNFFPVLVSLLFVFFLSSSSFGKGNPTVYSTCLSQAGSLNHAVIQKCASEASKQLKSEMKLTIAQLKKTRLKEKWEVFLKSQKLWKEHVELECQIEGEYIGSPFYSVCPVKKMEQRQEELKRLANEVMQ